MPPPSCRGQQSAQKEKLLKEEVEVMKATLSASEEGRARVSAQSKQAVSFQSRLAHHTNEGAQLVSSVQ